jgi:hypothetical protein
MASQHISQSCGNLWGTLGENRFPSPARARSVDVSAAVHYGTSQSNKNNPYCSHSLFKQDLAQASNPLNKLTPKEWGLLRNRAKSKYVLTQFLFTTLSLTRISALALP